MNLGDDADTTGAIFGQLAGAWYGAEGIPEEWRKKLSKRELIEQTADGLHLAALRLAGCERITKQAARFYART